MVDRYMVVAVYIDLVVVSFAEASAYDFDFVAFRWDLHELSLVPHGLSCIGIVFNSWLVVIYGLGHRLCVIRSLRVLLVQSRRMQSHTYLVFDADGPSTMIILNPVLNG
jgi:hypothetical protein